MDRAQHLSICRMAAVFLAMGIVAAALSLHAQDTRTVKEPVIPPACITLKATLTAASATSGDIEARAAKTGSQNPALDTARLQQAIDRCDKGRSVELAPDGVGDAFLIGPIALRAGVTLLIDNGVTLYGTRNPEYYAISPGSCGLVNDNSVTGCRPLIAIRNATGSGIMGDGAIDGQGGPASCSTASHPRSPGGTSPTMPAAPAVSRPRA